MAEFLACWFIEQRSLTLQIDLSSVPFLDSVSVPSMTASYTRKSYCVVKLKGRIYVNFKLLKLKKKKKKKLAEKFLAVKIFEQFNQIFIGAN